MNKRLSFLLCILALIGLSPGLCHAAEPDPPHIIFIMMDDLGYGSLGVYGSSKIDTPVLDQFAAEGRLFTQYSVAAPVCSPTRTSILTGENPRTYNIRNALRIGTNNSLISQVGIPDYVNTLPKMLRQAGYRTVHLGKWHIGGIDEVAAGIPPGTTPEFTPGAVGFDDWAIRVPSKSQHGPDGYWEEFIQPHDAPGFCLADGDPVSCNGGGRGTHFTEWLMDEAASVVAGHNNEKPLFLNIWPRAPHIPFNTPASDGANLTQAEAYVELVEWVDAQIGTLLTAIDNSDDFDNTLVIISSDNGAPDAEVGGVLESVHPNGDLVGQKGRLFEGGTRVPLLVRWPGQIAAASTSEFPAVTMDWYPTFAELAQPTMVSPDLRGQSLVAHLLGSTAPLERDHRLFFAQAGRAALDGPWKWQVCSAADDSLLFDMTTCTGMFCDQGLGLARVQACDPDVNPTSQHALAPEVIDRLEDRWFAWHDEITAIDWDVDSSTGDVSLRGQIYEFGAAGGQVTLCSPAGANCRLDDPKVNFHDQSFTFSVLLKPDPSAVIGPSGAWLAGREGAWELVLLDDDHVQLTLFDFCHTGSCADLTITSSTPLPTDRWSRFVWSKDQFRVGMWRDDMLQAFASSPPAVVSNDQPIVLGARDGSPGLVQPFLGSLADVQLFTDYFRGDEVDRFDRLEVDFAVQSTRGTPSQKGDVFDFATTGQVTLCADDTVGCSTAHPVFEVLDSAFTVGVTVRPTALPGPPALLAAKNDAWRLYHLANGKVQLKVFGTCGGGGCTRNIDSTEVLPLNQRSTVAFTVTPASNGDQTVRLYVGDTVDSDVLDVLAGGTKPVILGSRWNGSSLIETFSGELSDLRLFRAALDAEEVELLRRGEIQWTVGSTLGEPRIVRNVIHFDHTAMVADQVLLCGDTVPSGGAGCLEGDYPLFNVGQGGDFTVSFEMRPGPKLDIPARLIGKSETFYVHRTSTGLRLRVSGDSCGGCFVDLDQPVTLDEGRWAHVVVKVAKRSDGQFDLSFVVDGQTVTAIAPSIGFNDLKSVVLGSHFGGKRYRGSLRDVRLFVNDLEVPAVFPAVL